MRLLPLVIGLVLMAALGVAASPSTAQAETEPATVGPIRLAIPDGFEFAKSERQENAKISAWTKGSGSKGTLLQVSIVDMGHLSGSATPAELAQGSEEYLRQFLDGVRRLRSDYALSPVNHLSIAGFPAASATWTGKVDGLPTVGVMYCVIIQARYIVSFHTQAPGDTPTPWMREAMRSFENAQLRDSRDN